MINRVCDRRGRAGDSDFAHAARADRIKSVIRFADEIDIDQRNIGVGGDVIIGQIASRRHSRFRIVFGRFRQRHADAHDKSAQDLTPRRLGADDASAIHHADHARDLHARQQGIDFHFDEMRAPRLKRKFLFFRRFLFFKKCAWPEKRRPIPALFLFGLHFNRIAARAAQDVDVSIRFLIVDLGADAAGCQHRDVARP